MRRRSPRWRQTLRQELEPAFQELKSWLSWSGKGAGLAVTWLLERFLKPTAGWGRRRWLALTSLAALLWVWAVLSSGSGHAAVRGMSWGLARAQLGYLTCTAEFVVLGDPMQTPKDQHCYNIQMARSYTLRPLVFEAPQEALFTPEILRHILVAGFGFWLAFKLAALYQAEIYDLPHLRAAEHYLLQSALINPLSLLDIQSDDQPHLVQQRPIFRIGGPGMVRVDLEHATLFERPNGRPHVIGPTAGNRGQAELLEGFERLRQVINLRDQREQFQVPGRSKDGIRVKADDVQVVYSIYRAYQDPTYQRPYPFQDPQAVENLVYQRDKSPWTESMKIQVRGELLDFFANHMLTEFLAIADRPEWDRINAQEAELQRESQRISQTPDQTQAATISPPSGIDFATRPDITRGFYESSEERRTARGVQINWIGVGTWSFPVQTFAEKHLDAWRLSRDNILRGSPPALKAQQRLSFNAEVLRLVQTVPLKTFSVLRERGAPDDAILRSLVLSYHHHLNEALGEYERAIQQLEQEISTQYNPAERVRLTAELSVLVGERNLIDQIAQFLARRDYRWL